MAKIAIYQYDPLPDDNLILILELAPGVAGDALTATLEPVRIDAAGSYEALSYVWGDTGLKETGNGIRIRRSSKDEGLLVLAGSSILSALHRIRLPDRPRRIWADQCCINQNDPAERSQQV